jgi:hypothetical protein
MTDSSPSPPPSPYSRMSKDERRLWSRLSVACLVHPEPDLIRQVLSEAHQQGFDARNLYDLETRSRPKHWPPMPAWEQIAPTDD